MPIRTPSDVTAAIGRRWIRLRAPKIKYSTDLAVSIVTRDRVSALTQLVRWVEEEGMSNIIFFDNDSTYPPLLDYLASTQHEVVQLGRNMGHVAPWESGIVDALPEGQPFIVTDPDVIPDDQTHGAVKRTAFA